MDRVLVERMVGAVVLVLLLVILAPVLLDGSADNRAVTEMASAQDSNKRTQVIILNAPVNAPVSESAKEPVRTSKAIQASRQAAVKTLPAAGPQTRARQNSSKTVNETNSKPPQGFAVQLGSFAEQANAKRYVAAVKAQGFDVFVVRAASAEGAVYRVYSGPENSRDKAGTLAGRLKAAGHNGMIVKLGG